MKAPQAMIKKARVDARREPCKTYPSDPMYPDHVLSIETVDDDGVQSTLHGGPAGLTKREMMALTALQGILSRSRPEDDFERDADVNLAVGMADRLIARLNKAGS